MNLHVGSWPHPPPNLLSDFRVNPSLLSWQVGLSHLAVPTSSETVHLQVEHGLSPLVRPVFGDVRQVDIISPVVQPPALLTRLFYRQCNVVV